VRAQLLCKLEADAGYLADIVVVYKGRYTVVAVIGSIRWQQRCLVVWLMHVADKLGEKLVGGDAHCARVALFRYKLFPQVLRKVAAEMQSQSQQILRIPWDACLD